MLTLKQYQQRALETLTAYFQACQLYSSLGKANYAGLAFTDITSQLHDGAGLAYHPVAELPGMPYVCLRMPTGGGKTLAAAHAAGIAASELLHTDHPLILWLTPSTPIRDQTLKALQDAQHPYRQALESKVGAVTVLTIDEALNVQPGVLNSGATVIVANMQTFRVDNADLRKVYEPSGILMSHFDGDIAGDIEVYENGKPVTSLANVLRLHRPIVIVDEAHNARTPLSFETLNRFRPSCILEFTATPAMDDHPSNVLHTVSAAELKTEGMIKLPIRLETHQDWKTVLSTAVSMRNALEEIAREERALTGEYIRPIMLLQAQPERQHQASITVQVLKESLLLDQRIPENQVAISTGKQDDLGDTDLSAPTCPIRYIITVQKLREGWDCPFAYVLCTVAEQRSETAVEQILGRVLRLPKAQAKRHAELNKAYAFSASQHFELAALALQEALIDNGFERQEVKDLIAASQPTPLTLGFTDLPLFQKPAAGEPVEVPVAHDPQLGSLSDEVTAKVSYDTTRSTLMIRDALSRQEVEAIKKCFSSAQDQQAVDTAVTKAAGGKTYEHADRYIPFEIPVLAVKQGDFLEQFEETLFLDRPWKLAGRDPYLPEEVFPTNPSEGQQVEVDINAQGRIQTTFLGELHQQMSFLSADQDWSIQTLALWLDRKIAHIDLPSEQSAPFILSVIERLIQDRHLELGFLVKDKFRLKNAIEILIQKYRQEARKDAFNLFLLPEVATPLVVSSKLCFTFDPDPMNYPYSPDFSLYAGQHSFKKHLYPVIGNIKGGGEEYQCAQFLDNRPEIKMWVRNLERRPLHAFWLQTSSDKFYPDFVCLLKDGRYLVVEYKGEYLWDTPDALEKRAIGELWAERSNGKCLFIMPKGRDFEAIRAKIGHIGW